jgi:ribosomal protein L14
MLYVETVVKISDNSGGLLGLCIRILGSSKQRAAAGDAIVLAVKTIMINRKLTLRRKKKVLKGMVKTGVVLRTSYLRRRSSNFFFKNVTNAVAILGN